MSNENTAPAEPDYENMTDEELMNVTFPEGGGQASEETGAEDDEPAGGLLEDTLDTAAAAPAQPDLEKGAEGEQPEAGAQPADSAAKPDDADNGEGASDDPDHTTPHQSEADKAKDDAKADPAADADKGEADEEGKDDKADTAEPDYKALYEQVMAPFKANGREFQPSSPDEAMRLMQMGANYTKKMQGLKPHLRMMRMLENNGLLSEEKINFLIDLDKKDPTAVQKLMHDGKIDPLEIDTTNEPAYKPGNHSVSDQEMAFSEAIQDVGSTDDGKKTINHVNDTWDAESKKAIYAEPKILSIINEQRSNGVYDVISAEIDRQRTLGNLENVPFIHAYKQVGDRLQSEGAFGQVPGSPASEQKPVENTSDEPKARPIVDTRTAQPRKQMPNDDKARAASAGPKKAPTPKAAIDPFEMTDEQIMAIPVPHAR